MAGNGGYQAPSNPAQVSGPGAMSQRTDGQASMDPTQAARYIQGQGYGDSKALNEAAGGAPLAGGNEPLNIQDFLAGLSGGGLDALAGGLPQLHEGTTRPGEPVTTGNPYGPGAGADILGLPATNPEDIQDQEKAKAYLGILQAAEARGSVNNATKRLIQQMRMFVS